MTARWTIPVLAAAAMLTAAGGTALAQTAPQYGSAYDRDYDRSYGSDYGRDYDRDYSRDYGRDYGSDYGGHDGRDYGKDYDHDYGSRDYGRDYGKDYRKHDYAGSFDALSPGNQKIARSLFEGQVLYGKRDAWSLDRIAATKQKGEGWGQVFKRMKSLNLIDARNLGQLVSGQNKGAVSKPYRSHSSYSAPVVITNGANRQVYVGRSHGPKSDVGHSGGGKSRGGYRGGKDGGGKSTVLSGTGRGHAYGHAATSRGASISHRPYISSGISSGATSGIVTGAGRSVGHAAGKAGSNGRGRGLGHSK